MTTRTSIAAMRFASGSCFTLSKKSLPRTDGRRFLCSPKREAERRTAHHGRRALMGRRGRGPISGPLAFRRSSAVMRRDLLPTRPGPRFLESPDANGRTLSGTSAASTSRSGTRRTGRCPDRLQARATNSARRNRTRSVSRRHRLTSLTKSGMDAVIQIRSGAVKGFSISADKSRGCAERFSLVASPEAFHSTPKIRKSEVVPVNQGFLYFCESLRGCTVASGLHGAWDEQIRSMHHATFRGGPTNAIPNGSQNAGSVGAIAFALVISRKNASA
jgi:hypothetical protein